MGLHSTIIDPNIPKPPLPPSFSPPQIPSNRRLRIMDSKSPPNIVMGGGVGPRQAPLVAGEQSAGSSALDSTSTSISANARGLVVNAAPRDYNYVINANEQRRLLL